MVSPRLLRVLKINDKGANGELTNWIDVQKYFGSAQSLESLPDIVLCDIDFEDDDKTPLHKLCEFEANSGRSAEGGHKPTGLLYAIPFISMSRVLGRPLVVMIHSGSINLFSDSTENDPNTSWRRLLAAELCGLLRAIASDGDSFLPFKDAESSWDWLSSSRNPLILVDESKAERSGRRLYRQLLASRTKLDAPSKLVVDPMHYDEVVKWCAQMAKSDAVDINTYPDPGLMFISKDGSSEILSVTDLFKDGQELFLPSGFTILQNRNSLVVPNNLTKSGWIDSDYVSQVGQFVIELGDWPRAFELAAGIAEGLPEDGTVIGQTLAELAPDKTLNARMIRLLVLLFQTIRIYRNAWSDWTDCFKNYQWHPDQLTFGKPGIAFREGDLSGNTLDCYLRELHGRMQRCSNKFTKDEVREVLRADGISSRTNDDWLGFYLGLLLELKCIEPVVGEDERFKLRKVKIFPNVIPACPSRLVPAYIVNLRKTLAASLNSNDPTNLLKRTFGDALYSEEADAERIVLGQAAQKSLFDQGILPGWLKELCVSYCSRLGWVDQTGWPEFLK